MSAPGAAALPIDAPAAARRWRVLVVDDDPDTRANLCDLLELDDYEVETADSLGGLFNRTRWDGVLAILLDRILPDGRAEEAIPRLAELAPEAAVLVVTGHSDVDGAIAALRLGAEDYILKPIDSTLLRAGLSRIQRRWRLSQEKRQAEESLRRERDFAEGLISTAPAVILVLDLDGRIRRWNSYAEKLSGYAQEEVQGRSWFDTFIPPEDQPRLRDVFARLVARERLGPEVNVILTRSGQRREIEWSSTLLDEERGQGPGVLSIGHDVTELRRAQQKALQAERLAAIGQMVAGLAHESRNALQRSQACLEMLAIEVEAMAAARDLVGRIQLAQDHLHRLYEEVRGFAAPINLHVAPCDLSEVWRDAWGHLETGRRAKRLRLREQISAPCAKVPGDAFALGQVFTNILENAIAASPEQGEIILRCDAAQLACGAAIQVSVIDQGPGLTSEAKERIFEPFYTTKIRGTGLGMAIARRIVEAHGGRLSVANSPGAGAEITLVLPLEAGAGG